MTRVLAEARFAPKDSVSRLRLLCASLLARVSSSRTRAHVGAWVSEGPSRLRDWPFRQCLALCDQCMCHAVSGRTRTHTSGDRGLPFRSQFSWRRDHVRVRWFPSLRVTLHCTFHNAVTSLDAVVGQCKEECNKKHEVNTAGRRISNTKSSTAQKQDQGTESNVDLEQEQATTNKNSDSTWHNKNEHVTQRRRREKRSMITTQDLDVT